MELYKDFFKELNDEYNIEKDEDNIWKKIINYFSVDITEESKYAPVKDENFTRIKIAYDKLNDTGRKIAVERVEELAEIERYKK